MSRKKIGPIFWQYVHTWASPLWWTENPKNRNPEFKSRTQIPNSEIYLPENRKTGICGQYLSQKPEFWAKFRVKTGKNRYFVGSENAKTGNRNVDFGTSKNRKQAPKSGMGGGWYPNPPCQGVNMCIVLSK